MRLIVLPVLPRVTVWDDLVPNAGGPRTQTTTQHIYFQTSGDSHRDKEEGLCCWFLLGSGEWERQTWRLGLRPLHGSVAWRRNVD